MVLRYILLTTLTICFWSISAAEKVGELVFTDSYGINYVVSENPNFAKRIYFGNEIFRYLNEEDLLKCSSFLNEFLLANDVKNDGSFRQDRENTLSASLDLSKEAMAKIGFIWNNDFANDWNKLIGSLEMDEMLLSSSMEASYFANKIQDKFDKVLYNSNNGLSMAVVVSPGKQILRPTYNLPINRTSRKSKHLEFNEIVVQETADQLQFGICGPGKKAPVVEIASLLIANRYAQEIWGKSKIAYGINKTLWITPSSKSYANAPDLSPIVALTPSKFEQITSQLTSQLSNTVYLDQLFFYTYVDAEDIKWSLENITLEQFQLEITSMQTSKYVIGIPFDGYSTTDTSKIYTTDYDILLSTMKMKANSTKYTSTTDSILLDRVANFLLFNPEVKIVITGNAVNKEFIKITKEQKEELIARYRLVEPKFKVSKKTRLSLVRSLTVYNAIAEKHPNPGNIRCLGVVHKNVEIAPDQIEFEVLSY